MLRSPISRMLSLLKSRSRGALSRKGRGVSAEAFAAKWLKRNGAKILARDLADAHGQLDLVIRPPEGGVAVVEVRAHRAPISEALDHALLPAGKQRQIARTARRLLESSGVWSRDQNLRFDALFVALDGEGRAVSCRYLPNAFQPTQRDWF